jgi:hypothetical protein
MPIVPAGHTTNDEDANLMAVPPDAVRVWRGFRLGTLDPAKFMGYLGSIFIPATGVLQRLYGLTAYLPTVLPISKPVGLPDEIALVFYKSQQAYLDTQETVAGRAYSLLHQTVFDFPASQTGFPVLLESKLELDTPYHLFSDRVDWQGGFSQVFVGTREPSILIADFQSQLQQFFQKQQQERPSGLDAAVCCASSNWLLYWEHWPTELGAKENSRIADLTRIAEQVSLEPYVATKIESSLTANYPGVGDVDGKSFNILFPRL